MSTLTTEEAAFAIDQALKPASTSVAPAPRVCFGKIIGQSNADYHATEAVSASKLRTFARNPGGPQLYYQKYILRALPDEPSEAKSYGTALHCAILEPQKFSDTVAVLPEGIDRRTKAGKDAYVAFEALSAGKTVISSAALSLIEQQVAMLAGHSAAMTLLHRGVPEISWRVKSRGFPNIPAMQCRTDWFNSEGCDLTDGRPYVVDIKSCNTLEEDAFGSFIRSARDHNYDHQAALYMAILATLGVECRDFFFIALEKQAPLGVSVYRMSEYNLGRADESLSGLLGQLDNCYKTNTWPNTQPGIQELKIRRFREVDAREEAFA